MKTMTDVLPDWVFVGGGTQEGDFVIRKEDGTYYDLSGAEACLTVAPFGNNVNVVWHAVGSLRAANDADPTVCRAVFAIPAETTATWSGKYVYQVSIKLAGGTFVPPLQGRMFVTKNINPNVISG